jgi:signal transduction histidine kinase
METREASTDLTPDRLLEAVTRTLRHEVGDLLQTVYSTVAILQERLGPEAKLERRFLGDLRSRAETCKHELDAVHDLVLPITLKYGLVDLAELAGGLAASFGHRYGALQVQAQSSGPLAITADAQRLEQVGRLLLINACQSARSRVEVRTGPGPSPGQVEWSIANDGYGASAEQLLWLKTPFATTQQALFGLGLALARRVVELHGGHVTAANRPEGGFRVSIILPTRPPHA